MSCPNGTAPPTRTQKGQTLERLAFRNGCSNSNAPTLHHGTYRRAIMAVLSADVFTPAERVLANHNVHECQDGAKLALWLQNVRRVAQEREALAQTATLHLTDTSWNLRFANLIEKQELLAYAASKGFPIGREVDANDLGLGWNERQGKLYSFPAEWAGKAEAKWACQLIDSAQFCALVEAAQPQARVRYATAEQTSQLHQLALHRHITEGERTQLLLKLPRLTEAQATAKIEELQTLITNRAGAAAPAAEPTADVATPAQCEQVVNLASTLPRAQRRDALRRLPYLTEREAQSLILGLKLRRGPRYRVEVDKVHTLLPSATSRQPR